MERGIVVTISAGNNGNTGPIYSSSGSNGDGVLSIAAVNVTALYLGYHGGRGVHGPGIAKTVAERISTSGRSVAWGGDTVLYNQTAPPFQVGTCLVDAWKVLHFDTQLTAEPFALLDTESFKPDWTTAITNKGNSTITYTFELEPQARMERISLSLTEVIDHGSPESESG